ncbi:MAG: SpoIIE family protein phosphatase [Anaerolineales bacterium]|nr:SpoIIE family protein phosphatase [Anaerolineales bacterium]
MAKNTVDGSSGYLSKAFSAEDTHIQDFKARAASAEARGDWQTAAKYYAHGLEQRGVELALINSVQKGLSSNYEMQAIYDLVGDKLRDTFNAQVVMISQVDQRTNRIYHHYAIERGQHLQIPGWQPIDSSRAKVVRLKQPVLINQQEILALLEAEKMKVVPGTEIPKTWLGVPMLVGGEARGVVSLQNLDVENAFSPSDIDLLTALTNSMSQSLENARLFNETQRLLNLMEREMELSRQAQKSILPLHSPDQLGYDFGSLIVPARAVGGDFYDFIPMGDEQLCIAIGDISDKGLPAALFMAVTFSLVRAETGRSPNRRTILENVNSFLLKMDAKMFVTLLYCILDFKSGALGYSRAGHLPPIVINPDGTIMDLPVELGQPLGIFREFSIDQQEFIIPAGGLVLLYSDGLLEAVDETGRPFGVGRVRDILVAHRHKSAGTICKELWHAVQSYSGELLHQDDFTTVIIKRA